MNLAETAKLLVQIDVVGNAAAAIKGITKNLGDLDKAASGRISGGLKTLGTGLGVAFVNAGKIAVGAIGGITTAVALMVREGQEAAKTQTIYAQAVANSGKISTHYQGILAAQRTELMNLAGVDDELIQAEQTRLIQMGLNGKAVADLTPLVLDLSEATGVDLLTATLAVGKAANGNAGSLQKFGVFVDKAKFKVDPLAATMDALNQKFGGTTKALSGSLDTKLRVFNENLANIREEAGIKLLPALTRLIDVAGRKLVPAFGKFIDKILPTLIKGIEDVADILESGGVERGFQAITDAIGPMLKVLQMAVGPVKAIVAAFLRLPQKVQAALISGFIINKLSGGLVASGGKDVIGGVASLAGPSVGAAFTAVLQKIGLTRGSSPAAPLFVMDVQNRLPNGQFAPGFTQQPTKLGKIAAVASKVFLIGAAVGVFAELKGVLDEQSAANRQQAADLTTQTKDFAGGASIADLESSLAGIETYERRLLTEFSVQGFAFRSNIDGVKTAVDNQRAILQAQLDALRGIRNAVGGIPYTGGGRPAIDDPIRPRGPASSAPRATEDRGAFVRVQAVSSTRDSNIARTVKARLGPTADMVGAI